MELRGPENDIRPSVYTSSSLERRNNNNNNNNGSSTVLPYTQTLDRNSSLPRSSASKTRYRECLRNHAASVGGNVYDGCGEFMPGGEEGSLEALKCAACDCHRNFHRKEVDGETQFSPSSRRSAAAVVHSLQLPPPLPSPTMLHHQRYSTGLYTSPTAVQPMAVAFGGGGGGGTESSSEDLNVFGDGMPHPPPYVLSKKRFRTKFTQDQKERMMEFAEKIGWRINKIDEEEVDKFCADAGIRRQVFKVWMHNNKNVKKQQNPDQEHEQEPEQEHEPAV
ncbi:Zinc-finger homeodomain protein 6 [Euphorbia peplus]|nr:Zinc-finger homeodomain protein 6 [Euphorbia peplus]